MTKRRQVSRSASTRPTKARRALFPSRTVAIARPSVGLGLSATTVLRTSFFANVTANAGTGVYTGFLKTGSAFDPAGDIAALQPQMYDQWAALYNRYKVNSCVVRMRITGSYGSLANVWVCAAYPCVDTTPVSTYQAAASQQYAKTTSGGYQVKAAAGAELGIGTEGRVMSFKLDNDAVVGIKADAFDNGALVTADPPTLQYSNLALFIQANANTNASLVLEIDMWQNVTFSQKKNTADA